MPYVNERGVLSNSRPWSLSRLSDMFWGFFNVVYFFFQSLLEPLVNAGSRASGSSDGRSRRGPPRPPGGPRGNFRSLSDSMPSPGSFPMAGG